MELALANGFFRGSVSGKHRWTVTAPQDTKDRWKDDPPLVRDFTFLANAEGFSPISVEGGRQIVLRYARFLTDQLGTTLEDAGWREYAAYKLWLAQSGIARTSARVYLFYVQIFYRLRAQTYQDSEVLETYMRIRALGAGRRGRGRRWKPLDSHVVKKLLGAAQGEDYIFLMTLLYTGGRAQFYGLRVENLALAKGELQVEVKGGKETTIPIHPRLARVLKEHLASRGYNSPFLFRNGKNTATFEGQRANRQNAWRICKRVQHQAGIGESIHPHRFRKTLAAYVRQTGTDPQVLQAILGHARLDRTLDDYTQVEIEEVKRLFSSLDPVNGHDNDAAVGPTEARDLLGRLRGLGPKGREQAWAQLVDGMLGLIGG